MFCLNWKILSLEKSRFNIAKLQIRIFKSILVGDVSKSLSIQKLLLFSQSARLLSIQSSFFCYMFQSKKKISFNDKIKLNFLLLNNLNFWNPSYNFFANSVFSFSDICWQNLVMLALLPAHEATFSPLNFGFRAINSIYFFQRIFLLKLSDNYLSLNMKILRIKFFFPKEKSKFLIRFVLSKLLIPRLIKVSFFKYFSLGFDFTVSNSLVYSWNNLQSFLINLVFDNFGFYFDYIQFGSTFFFFIEISKNEFFLIKHIDSQFLEKKLFLFKKEINILFPLQGFNLLDWYLKLLPGENIFFIPSMLNYSSFLKRVKNIINNSNYGAVCLFIEFFSFLSQKYN